MVRTRAASHGGKADGDETQTEQNGKRDVKPETAQEDLPSTKKEPDTVRNGDDGGAKGGADSGANGADGDKDTAAKHVPAKRSPSPEGAHKRQKTTKEEADGGEAKTVENGGAGTAAAGGGARDNDADEAKPQILEKGAIYFFFRGRVNVDEPHGLADVARTYIVLQPGDGDDGDKNGKDGGSCRLLALPKKVLPRSGRERYMAFVEKAGVSYAALEREFLTGSEYETKTARAGSEGDGHHQHVPAATSFGEGVYALTTTGRASHLAYVLTLPRALGAVQRQLGLVRAQGSFIVSVKNPAYPGPGGGPMVGGGPDYPKEIRDSFRSLRWVPLRPEYLDYPNGHILLVGESSGTEKAFGEDQPSARSREVSAEVEELADEDLNRMQQLGESDAEAIFTALKAKDQAEGQPEPVNAFG
ncbi:hypothetical protein SPI_04745 [Niveomyces insectorum RCEF 264]|uniref:BTB domain transcription factor n=1 Tax=Niveomyces insectorum RCEF 264 TaxID=1081102 RepID=A0A167UT73_9HYPO|nr:hypothetical protein SPI_04745 [Niveomyces insectorum RCEF 264]